jgi:hypothetical protein
MNNIYSTQNDLLLHNLLIFYKHNNNIEKLLKIIGGNSKISLRIVDWFATNYAKKYYTLYNIISRCICKDNKDVLNPEKGIINPKKRGAVPCDEDENNYYNCSICCKNRRFKVYDDYKLKLKAYSKKRFDPFCRWERISIPYKNDKFIETTIGQLNFFKWALENNVIKYIEDNYSIIENDMNNRNSTSKKKQIFYEYFKTRKKREELSISASKSIKKEKVEIILEFN